jgi:hypothetical protein
VAGRYDKAARKEEKVQRTVEMERRRKEAGGASPQVCQHLSSRSWKRLEWDTHIQIRPWCDRSSSGRRSRSSRSSRKPRAGRRPSSIWRAWRRPSSPPWYTAPWILCDFVVNAHLKKSNFALEQAALPAGLDKVFHTETAHLRIKLIQVA